MMRFSLVALGAGLALAVGCSSDPAASTGNGEGPICATCGPSTGGETGDFGGSLVDCRPYFEEVAIETDEAAQASLAELERRLSRPIDEPFSWSVPDDENPGRQPLSASGYQTDTRVGAAITPTGAPAFQRNNCREPSDCENCFGVSSYIVVDIRVAFATADGAVHAMSTGWASIEVAETPDSETESLRAQFNSDVDLKDVRGTLRIATPPESTIGGRLHFWSWLYPDGAHGGASIPIDVDGGANADLLYMDDGRYFFPLTGDFGVAR